MLSSIIVVISLNDWGKETSIVQNAKRDLYNAQEMTINQYYIGSKADIEGKYGKLEIVEPIDYFLKLQEKVQNKYIVERNNIVLSIDNLLKNEVDVLLYGDSGAGKTTIVTQIAENKDAIYISFRRFSSLKIILYLVNSVRKDKGLEPIYIEDTESLLDHLENELVNSSFYFFFDDCEKNIEAVNLLREIERFENKFIFISGVKNLSFETPIVSFKIDTFNPSEIKEFLRNKNIELSIVRLNEVISFSNGNPLYLEYFSRFQLTPLPRDLEVFLNNIWMKLNKTEKNILSLLSVSLTPLTPKIMLIAINKIMNINLNPFDLNEQLESLSGFLDINDGHIEISHSYFLEFIKKQNSQSGLMEWYKGYLGEVLYNEEAFVEAIPLLLDIQDDKIFKDLIYVFPYYIEKGLWELAIRVLNKFITLNGQNMNMETGYAYYHLTYCYNSIGEKIKSQDSLAKAIKIFENSGDKEWLSICQVWKVLDLSNDGRLEEAKKLCLRIMDQDLEEKHIEATLLVNISKFYVDIFEFEKGALVAQRAFEIFGELNDKRGIIASLVNLSICLVQMEKLEKALEYCEILKGLSEEDENKVLKAIVLNNMTICYRKLNEPELAETVCLESIQLWVELEQKNKVAMNLLNLGNVFRDIGNYDQAKKYYLEGLEVANEIELFEEQGRANELIANISIKQGKLEEAIDYAKIAIEFSLKAKDNHRVAEAIVEMAFAQKKLNQLDESAKSYKKSLEYYLLSHKFDEALYSITQTIEMYKDLENYEELNFLWDEIIELIDSKAITLDLENIDSFIELCNSVYKEKQVSSAYLMFFQNALEDNTYIKTNITLQLLSFFKKKRDVDRQSFIDIVTMIVPKLNESNWGNTLALLIEQSGDLMSSEVMFNLLDVIQKNTSRFYYRLLENKDVLITYSWNNNKMFQLRFGDSDVQIFKLGVFISLIMKVNQDLFDAAIEQYYEENFTIYLIDNQLLDETKNDIFEEINRNDFPAIFLGRSDYTIWQPIVIRSDYYTQTDFSSNPDNKIIVWVLMILFNSVVAHFTHKDFDDNKNVNDRRSLVRRVVDFLVVKGEEKVDNELENKFLSKQDILTSFNTLRMLE